MIGCSTGCWIEALASTMGLGKRQFNEGSKAIHAKPTRDKGGDLVGLVLSISSHNVYYV